MNQFANRKTFKYIIFKVDSGYNTDLTRVNTKLFQIHLHSQTIQQVLQNIYNMTQILFSHNFISWCKNLNSLKLFQFAASGHKCANYINKVNTFYFITIS